MNDQRVSESIVENPQRWAYAFAALAVGLVVCVVLLVDVRPAIQQWGRVPERVAELQTAVEIIPGQLVAQVTPLIDRHAKRIEGIAQGEIRHGVDAGLSTVKQSLTVADARLQSIQDQAEVTTKGILAVADTHLAGIRADLKPTLVNTAALVQDAKDSWDDLYFDVKATVGSATVATTSVARASEAVAVAAPKLAESVEGITANVEGITADVHTATTDFVRPKTIWQHIKMWLETTGKIGARFL